ncbi:MAG: DsbA family protein [Bacilli bacterium]|nr:DsbA family protein [Bacilli bacterium]
MDKNTNFKKIDVYYFTDPLCSHCWALDTALTKFKLEYKDYINLHTIMGGMVEDGNHYENLNGPEAKEQASHWEQVGKFYRIPMNGKIWMKDPITSSFPSSIAYLLIKKHNEGLATKFLRMVREGAFVFEKNIAKPETLKNIASDLGIDDAIIKESFSESGKQVLFENLQPMIDLGVTGFPTVIMVNSNNEGIKIVGARTADTYKRALAKVVGEDVEIVPADLPKLSEYLDMVPTVFFHEIEKMYDLKSDDVKSFIKANLSKEDYELGEIANHKYIRKSR